MIKTWVQHKKVLEIEKNDSISNYSGGLRFSPHLIYQTKLYDKIDFSEYFYISQIYKIEEWGTFDVYLTIFSRVFYFVVYPSQKILFFNSSKTLCGILMKRCSEALNFCTYILKSNCPTHFHAQITCLRSHSKIADYKLLMKMNPFLLKEPFCSYGSRFGNKLKLSPENPHDK